MNRALYLKPSNSQSYFPVFRSTLKKLNPSRTKLMLSSIRLAIAILFIHNVANPVCFSVRSDDGNFVALLIYEYISRFK